MAVKIYEKDIRLRKSVQKGIPPKRNIQNALLHATQILIFLFYYFLFYQDHSSEQHN